MFRTTLVISFSLAVSAILFNAHSARADVAAARCDVARGSHVDVLSSTYSDSCLGHVERDKEGRFKSVVVLPEPMSGDVRATRDTRVVVYVATYMPLLKHEALERNPVVMRAYRDGVLIKEQRLLEIATAADITESISHVRFTRELGDVVSDDGKLVLVTNSGKRVVIEVPA